MGEITLKFNVDFADIDEVINTEDKLKTIIKFKSGDQITFRDKQAKRVFKTLQRNFPGEQLD